MKSTSSLVNSTSCDEYKYEYIYALICVNVAIKVCTHTSLYEDELDRCFCIYWLNRIGISFPIDYFPIGTLTSDNICSYLSSLYISHSLLALSSLSPPLTPIHFAFILFPSIFSFSLFFYTSLFLILFLFSNTHLYIYIYYREREGVSE
jgi:hypothetical protein